MEGENSSGQYVQASAAWGHSSVDVFRVLQDPGEYPRRLEELSLLRTSTKLG